MENELDRFGDSNLNYEFQDHTNNDFQDAELSSRSYSQLHHPSPVRHAEAIPSIHRGDPPSEVKPEGVYNVPKPEGVYNVPKPEGVYKTPKAINYESAEAQPLSPNKRAASEQPLNRVKNKRGFLEKLYKENQQLKKKLGKMSEKLNEQLEKVYTREQLKQKAKPKNPVSEGREIETAKSKLAHYKAQHAKVTQRYNQIMKPETHHNLINSISQLQTGIEDKKVAIRNKQLEQKARSKKLETKMDTGETEDMYANYTRTRDELTYFLTRNAKVEKRVAKNAQCVQQLSELESKTKTKANEQRHQYKALPKKKVTDENEEQLKMEYDNIMENHLRNWKNIENSISKLKSAIAGTSKQGKQVIGQREVLQQMVTSRNADLKSRSQRLESMRSQAASTPSLHLGPGKLGMKPLRSESTKNGETENVSRLRVPAFITEGDSDSEYV